MTGLKGESAVSLFVIFGELLKLCGALRNFAGFPKALPLVVVSSFPKALPLGKDMLGFSFADLRFSLLIVPG
ncbi:MAG: hypothetical protein WCP85_20205 [Mariniphaga sp.]